jgi:hypothetical protein
MFRKALELSPGHKEALTELAAMGAAEAPEEPPAEKTSILNLKKFFKKN